MMNYQRVIPAVAMMGLMACAPGVLSDGNDEELDGDLERYAAAVGQSGSLVQACKELNQICQSTGKGCMALQLFCSSPQQQGQDAGSAAPDKAAICNKLKQACSAHPKACQLSQQHCAGGKPHGDGAPPPKPDGSAPPPPPKPDAGAPPPPPKPDAAAPPPAKAACTQVIGYSQVNQWFGAFEQVTGSDAYQLLWNGGAGVDQWRDPAYKGWTNQPVSPCVSGSSTPDRVLLSVSGPYGSDVAQWVAAIQATIKVIHQKLPAAKQILLQPVVGGPGHKTCTLGGKQVRASWQHAQIDQAITKVVASAGSAAISVKAGTSPEVGSCADYKDSTGHLTSSGAAAAGQAIGAYYAGK